MTELEMYHIMLEVLIRKIVYIHLSVAVTI